MDNPFFEAISEISGYAEKRANRAGLQCYIGVVRTVEPFEVEIAGTIQRAANGNLYINPRLLQDYDRPVDLWNVSGDLTGLGGFGDGEISAVHAIATDYDFDTGDNLVVLSREQQTFYILCKVVQMT